jgi:16S rRNA (adenine1518-N6/adenine1519-N6)-dimethyltransferase
MPELLQQYGRKSSAFKVKADKKLGQHFLIDKEICDRIALSNGDLSQSLVVEIGPGTGELTQSIIALHPGVELLLIETDKRFIPLLQEIQQKYLAQGGSLTIIEGDALKIDWLSITNKTNKKCHIIANLPYNIGTELLFTWLQKEIISQFFAITVMLQKEVVERVIALKGSKKYSWLSIISQLFCEKDLLFDIPPIAFYPQPKVMSSLLYLQPRVTPLPFHYNNLQYICKKLFLYRRKSLKAIIKMDDFLQSVFISAAKFNLDMQLRPEQLDVELLCQLSLLISEKSS